MKNSKDVQVTLPLNGNQFNMLHSIFNGYMVKVSNMSTEEQAKVGYTELLKIETALEETSFSLIEECRRG